MKELLSDPEKLAALQASATSAAPAAGGGDAKEEKKEEAKEVRHMEMSCVISVLGNSKNLNVKI